MRQMSLQVIEKKLVKRNCRISGCTQVPKKIRRQKKEICADIESLQNQKVEYIFAQVKREIKSEKLDISSGFILLLLEVLRKNQQIITLGIDSSDSFAVENLEIEYDTE